METTRRSHANGDTSHVIELVCDPVSTVESVEASPEAEILVNKDPNSVFADRCRFLRANLRPLWSQDKLKSLLITSPFPHDGKSTIALNLAITIAERRKRRVLLMEADLHHPTLTQRLGLSKELPGLADCLERDLDPFSVVRSVDPIGIYLVPAGKPREHPTELLQSDLLSGIMQSYREQFDSILVDSPPVKPLSDALLLRQRTDATLLVLRVGRTLKFAADEAVELLGKKHILGMVINGIEGLERAYSHYYGSYGVKVK
jgi:capsular exopolysaccharide synthesis family protein